MRDIRSAIQEPTPHGIAGAISRLITSGELAPGDRLPTVRELASALGVSPATVSHAWRTLASAGLIVSRGRSGSFVRSVPREWLPRRYRGLEGALEGALDLSRGSPDPALLPDLAAAFARASRRAEVVSYQAKPDIPELHDLLRETWPSAVESITVTNGALDAIDRVLAALARYGDRVVVESPTFPPFIDLMDSYGLEPIRVPLDEHGPRVDAFAAALAQAPSFLLLQPRAQNPTGVSTTPARLAELAGMLARSRSAADAIVIEDDHSAEISVAPAVTFATVLPERTLHVRSLSKSHGPDLRVGALGGPRPLVDRVVARRLLGPGWTSRMIQVIVYELMTEPQPVAEVALARETYAARQRTMSAALAVRGVRMPTADGINLWLPVADERSAAVQLAATGIRVAPGAPFQLGDDGPHVRVTVGAISGELDPIADALAAATRA
ncbi:aminotransferase class I/II-fold pyridoxal phosphate-dependent enzyme [Galbitalea sp. SE-J8]|uniref:aminotransferase class I/II-fold pyridoxal phosphate-dependent enzyme n=1 Tax=Galbitalea sp. SE-J8 TaxID=3054952 RepID=UPI00259D11B6|nr:aminotransferase class I/II-fold pyridoxal phosphate-dependent enzyme [Galbitalea sp. SE-J8]MDM4762940.1 aminotransferase class I/II-fold pyridoxal phosphate-dependent enzyme [Galbitalea sp. SE-J8]